MMLRILLITIPLLFLMRPVLLPIRVSLLRCSPRFWLKLYVRVLILLSVRRLLVRLLIRVRLVRLLLRVILMILARILLRRRLTIMVTLLPIQVVMLICKRRLRLRGSAILSLLVLWCPRLLWLLLRKRLLSRLTLRPWVLRLLQVVLRLFLNMLSRLVWIIMLRMLLKVCVLLKRLPGSNIMEIIEY